MGLWLSLIHRYLWGRDLGWGTYGWIIWFSIRKGSLYGERQRCKETGVLGEEDYGSKDNQEDRVRQVNKSDRIGTSEQTTQHR